MSNPDPVEAGPRRETGGNPSAGLVLACAALFVATQAGASPPRCRLLSDPAKLTPLSEGTVDDLNSRKSRLDPDDLRTTNEGDARIAAAVRANPDRTVWAWVTCYQGFDPVMRRKTFQGACIGFWPQRRS